MPTLHREAGFTFFFRALDRSEPAHIDVVGNGGRAKVWLVPRIAMTGVRGYDVRQRALIVKITEEYADEWHRAWNEFFGSR